MSTSATWNDPNRCPFCGDVLTSPGEGFVDHVEESPECESEFGIWRENVGGDIAGGWSG